MSLIPETWRAWRSPVILALAAFLAGASFMYWFAKLELF